MFQRFRQARHLPSSSIGYYRGYALGPLMEVGHNDTRRYEIVRNGFIIGLNIHDTFVPIYDDRARRIVRIKASGINIGLNNDDALLIPYFYPWWDSALTRPSQISRRVIGMLQSLRRTRRAGTTGIAYYQSHPLIVIGAHLTDVRNECLTPYKVEWYGFVIGLYIDDQLVPIYDDNYVRIVVNTRTQANIVLIDAYAKLIPYFYPWWN